MASQFKRFLAYLPALVLASLTALPPAKAQCRFELRQFIEYTGDAISIAASEEFLVVCNSGLEGIATVDVYRRSGRDWIFDSELRRFTNLAHYKVPVAIDQDTIAVSDSQGRQRVWVYRNRNDSWELEQTITAPEFQSFGEFGESLSIHGNRLAIGAPAFHLMGSSIPGGAFIYIRQDSEWILEHTISGIPYPGYGTTLALDDDRLLLGTDGGNQKAAYTLFYRPRSRTWFREDPLRADEEPVGSIDLHGPMAAIGLPHANPGEAGKVEIYTKPGDQWVLSQTINPPLPSETGFGQGVALNEFALCVTSQFNISVYSRVQDQWSLPQTFFLPQTLTGSMSLYDDGFVVAARAGDQRYVASYSITSGYEGTVSASLGQVEDVLFLNGTAGSGFNREVEYDPLSPFELSIRRPSSVPFPESLPFVVYAWPRRPTIHTVVNLPYSIGCMALPIPMTGGSPQPTIIWNSAGRMNKLGRSSFPVSPSPGAFFSKEDGLPAISTFFIQGLIFDPGSGALVPASVTNAIVGVPVVGGR